MNGMECWPIHNGCFPLTVSLYLITNVVSKKTFKTNVLTISVELYCRLSGILTFSLIYFWHKRQRFINIVT